MPIFSQISQEQKALLVEEMRKYSVSSNDYFNHKYGIILLVLPKLIMLSNLQSLEMGRGDALEPLRSGLSRDSFR